MKVVGVAGGKRKGPVLHPGGSVGRAGGRAKRRKGGPTGGPTGGQADGRRQHTCEC